MALPDVKALFFDVFGTVVDWRSTVTNALHAEAQKTLTSKADDTFTEPSASIKRASTMALEDWGSLAQDWRTSYHKFVLSVTEDPSVPYKTVDQHHHDALVELLDKWRLTGLWSAPEVQRISLIWHSLDPWPDSAQGIRMFNKRFQTSTLSNGNVSLLTDMAEHAKLEWTHILSAEMFGTYKPSPKVYLGGAEKLALEPSQCCMVAAHLPDLQGAKRCGFKVIYVERKQEEEWDSEKIAEAKRDGWVDIWVTLEEDGFLTVASKLGC